jgi:hypothetical protein
MCPLYQTCRLVRAWDCSLQLCVRHGIVLAVMCLSRSGNHGSVFAVVRLSAMAAIWRLLALLTIYIYIYIYIYAFIYLSLVHAYVCDCCSGARSTSSAGSTCGLPACTPLQEKHKQKQYINIATLHDCMSKDILNLATTNYDAEIAHQVHGSKTRKQSRCLCVQYCLVSAFVYMHGFSSRPCLWAALGTHSSTFGG